MSDQLKVFWPLTLEEEHTALGLKLLAGSLCQAFESVLFFFSSFMKTSSRLTKKKQDRRWRRQILSNSDVGIPLLKSNVINNLSTLFHK